MTSADPTDLEHPKSSDSLVDDLQEDFDTAWVPDVVSRLDYRAMASTSPPALEQRISPLTVPRPDERPMKVFALPFQKHALLHDSVANLRDSIDSQLLPTVFGYRRGAQAGTTYRSEHARFAEATAGMAESAGYVVAADVAQFFRSVRPTVLLSTLASTVGASDLAPLSEALVELESEGVVGLPSGYADARLLGNAILSVVDRSIQLPFTRWVDDYRLFAKTESSARDALARMRASLTPLGLSLNEEKVRIYSSDTKADVLWTRPLESVYHPEREQPAKTAASLMALFQDAAADPKRNRRELRFVLRRMALERDRSLADYAIEMLEEVPWEAPRLAAYLGSVELSDKQAHTIMTVFCNALSSRDDWLVARLAPLMTRLSPSNEALQTTNRHLARTQNTPAVWGLILRVLSRAGKEREVSAAIRSRTPDPRATIAACVELQLPVPPRAADAAPSSAAMLTGWDDIPLPSIDSIL